MEQLSLVDHLKNYTANIKSIASSSLDVNTEASTVIPEQVEFGQVFATMLSSQSALVSGLFQNETDICMDAVAIDAIQTAVLSELKSQFLSEKGLASIFPVSKINSNVTTPLVDAPLEQDAHDRLTSNLVNIGVVDKSSYHVGSESDSDLMSNLMQFGFGVNGLDKNDLFDTMNVLNHVPLVSDIYQSVTDTNISNVSKLAGGFIYGGTPGLALSVAEVGVDYFSGYKVKDLIGLVGLSTVAKGEGT